MRKVLGGGWRQAGFLAAAGLVALDRMVYRLQEDHDHIYQIAKAIHSLNSKHFRVDLENVQTNILMMYLDRSKVEAREVQHRLATVLQSDAVKVSVRTSSRDPACVRFVMYWEISEEDVRAAIDKILLVINEFETKFRGF